MFRHLRLVVMAASVLGCGDSLTCDQSFLLNDPSGRWSGVLARVESDCAGASRGTQFAFEHNVSVECVDSTDSELLLLNEEGLQFSETSSSILGGGFFVVENEQASAIIEISYDNFDGDFADVTEKVRLYSSGRIVCSERYTGQARR